jgi:hypothetical protein
MIYGAAIRTVLAIQPVATRFRDQHVIPTTAA